MVGYVQSAHEKVKHIKKKYKSLKFRMDRAMYEYMWYETLLAIFPSSSEEIKQAMQVLADFYLENEKQQYAKGEYSE